MLDAGRTIAIFQEGHLMTIPSKLVLILTTGFRGYFQTFLHNGNWPIPLATMFSTDQICFSCFCRRSPSDYFAKLF